MDCCSVVTRVSAVDCCVGADDIGMLFGSLVVEFSVERAKVVGCRGGCSVLQIVQ